MTDDLYDDEDGDFGIEVELPPYCGAFFGVLASLVFTIITLALVIGLT